MKKYWVWIMVLVAPFFCFAQSKTFSLEQAVNYALENNYDVLNAENDIASAEKRVWESIATGLPQVNANLDYDYYIQQPVSILPDFITPAVIQTNRELELITEDQAQAAFRDLVGPPQAVVFGTPHNFNAGITVEQLLFSGSYIVGLQSAKVYKNISELSKEKTEAALKEAIINSYAAVLVADENVEILTNNLTVSDRNLYEISEIYKAGLGEEQSVDQARYTNSQLKAALNYAKRQRESVENSLKFLMGIQQEKEISLTTKLDEITQPNQLFDPNAEANPNHINKRLAENNLKAQELELKYQKSFALPTLNAFLSHSYSEAGQELTFFDDNKTTFQTTLLGIRMAIPVFSSLQRSAQTQQAKIELDKAKVEYQKTLEDLKQKQRNTYLAYESSIENLNTAKELVQLSQNIYEKERIKFFEGLSQSFDLRNAESQLFDAQNNYIQSILDVVQKQTALQQAYGNF